MKAPDMGPQRPCVVLNFTGPTGAA
jgi:hypothetical protein